MKTISIIMFLLLSFLQCQCYVSVLSHQRTNAYLQNQYKLENSRYRTKHRISTSADTKSEVIQDSTVISQPKYIQTANTQSYQISLLNPFGPPIKSSHDAKAELKAMLDKNEVNSVDNVYRHCRIEYLIKVLESKYIPIQTLPFLNLALAGDWTLKYSNVLTPHQDDKISIIGIIQKFDTVDQNQGRCTNLIKWQYEEGIDRHHSRGQFIAESRYSINSKGSIALYDVNHSLLPDIMPHDAESLILSLQRSLPFEIFDPSGIVISHMHMDVSMRIVKISSPRFLDVVNIYVK